MASRGHRELEHTDGGVGRIALKAASGVTVRDAMGVIGRFPTSIGFDALFDRRPFKVAHPGSRCLARAMKAREESGQRLIQQNS